MSIRKIAIATGTRADWGLLSPLAAALHARPDCEVVVLATNMHLSPLFGDTFREVRADFPGPVVEVPMELDAPMPLASASCMAAMAKALAELDPDMLVILGDRFEMLATASAALLSRIPIVHIAGGEISEGAVDDSVRHAITKMASLHLTATEQYRRRVIEMGEMPDRVVNTGAIGVWNSMNVPLMSRPQLEEDLDWRFGDSALLVTYHVATLSPRPPQEEFAELLTALDALPGCNILFTYPNNDGDASSGRLIEMIHAYADRWPGRVKVVPSLGRVRYLSALRCVKAVVGNSSSGIVEVPSAGIPTVDIGIRQRGRLSGPSVHHCEARVASILSAVREALASGPVDPADNPYARPDTLGLMVRSIAETPLESLKTKHFHDVEDLSQCR